MKIVKHIMALSALALCLGFVGCAAEEAATDSAESAAAETETDAAETDAAPAEGGSESKS